MHLSAARDEDASRAATLLTDAFRTATLAGGDEGTLVVIRRLVLGRIRTDVSPAALALHIERVVSRAAADAVPFDRSGSSAASAVAFPDRAEPLVALARLQARRATTDAWFWPAVVPGWNAAWTSEERWLLLLDAAHALPEAAVVAAAIVNEAVQARAGRELVSVIPAGRADAWLRRAGWNTFEPAPLLAEAAEDIVPAAVRAAEEFGPHDHRVVWLSTMLAVHASPARAADASLPARIASVLSRRFHVSATAAPAAKPATGTTSGESPRRATPDTTQAPVETGDGVVASEVIGLAAPARTLPDTIAAPLPPVEPTADAPHDPLPSPAPRGYYTPYAGLFLVVPILARLRVAAFFASRPDYLASGLPVRLLWFIGARVGLTAGDPLATALRDGSLLQTPAVVTDAARGVHLMWLSAVRRWCRRTLRMGLKELIARPGRVYVSRTHVEVTFDLTELDLRIRRVALDVDPGWVPWLGRILTFRYVEEDDTRI